MSSLSVIGYINFPEPGGIIPRKHSGAVILLTIRPGLNVLLGSFTGSPTRKATNENVFVVFPCSTGQVTEFCMLAIIRHKAGPLASSVRVRVFLSVKQNVNRGFLILYNDIPFLFFFLSKVIVSVSDSCRTFAFASNSGVAIVASNRHNSIVTGFPCMLLASEQTKPIYRFFLTNIDGDVPGCPIIQQFSIIPIRPHNHKGAEAGGLKGQGAVGISKDIQNLHIVSGLVEHFQRVGSCAFHFRQSIQTGNGNGSNITLGRLHLFALGVLGGDLQAQNGHHFPKAVLVALIEGLHIVITHVDDAEVICGRGQVFHFHRQIDALRVAILVLVGGRGLGFQIHRHGVLVHQILVIHGLFLIGAHGAILPCGVDVHGGGLVVQNVAGGVGEVQAHPVAKLVQRVPVVKQPQFALGVPVGGGVLDVAAVIRNGLCPGHSLNEVQIPQNLAVPGQILALRHIVDLCLSGNVLQVKGVQLPQPEAVDHHILQLFDLVAGNDHFVIRLFHHVVLAGPLGLGAGAGVGTGAGAGVVLNDGAPLCFLNVGAAVEVVLAAFHRPGGFLLAAFHRPGGFVPAAIIDNFSLVGIGSFAFIVYFAQLAVVHGREIAAETGNFLVAGTDNILVLGCKHRHKAGADDRKRQTKRKNTLHQPIFFSVMIFPHSGALPAS